MIRGISRTVAFFFFGMDSLEVDARPCPICKSVDKKILGEDREGVGLEYAQCKCGMVYASKYFSRIFLEKFYSIWYSKLFSSSTQNRDYSAKKADLILDLLRTSAFACFQKVCDFGCGNGAVLEQLDMFDIRVGFDYEPEITKLKNNQSLELKDFSSLDDYQGHFDVCLSIQVMEHLLDPFEHLLDLKKLLKDDGVIYLEVPLAKVNEVEQAELKIPHCNLFSFQSVNRLADITGLLVLASNDSGGFLLKPKATKHHISYPENEITSTELVVDKSFDTRRKVYRLALRLGRFVRSFKA